MPLKHITDEERAYCERLASLAGWDVAKELGLSYSGDSDPINYGGYFYNPAKWDEWGYAPCVEFTAPSDWESDRLRVERGTINRPKDMDGAFRCCDVPEEFRHEPAAQIEAVRYYHGFEPDDGDSFRTYDPDTWTEWRLWRSILPMLRSLRDEV